MKLKTKIILYGLAVIFIAGAFIYIGIGIGKRIPQPDNSEIEALNTQLIEASNKTELERQAKEMYKDAWEKSVIAYNDQFDNINYQDPNITDIPQVGEYIPFVSDSTYFNPDFIVEKRKAKLDWSWIDKPNKYSIKFKGEFDYATHSLYVTPELTYNPPKNYPFTASFLLASNGYGAMLDFSFWRINLGVGGIVTKEIEGIALLKAGFSF